MTIMRRILSIGLGLLTVALAVFIFLNPETGIYVAIDVFALLLFVYSIRMIVYFIRLARHKTGGQIVLFLGVIALSCSLYAIKIQTAPRDSITTVLVIILIATGVIDLLKAREAKTGGSASWKGSMISAIIVIILALSCQFLNKTYPEITGLVFGITLCYSGIARIVAAMRKASWSKMIKNLPLENLPE